MNINFMRFRKIAISISLILFVSSIGSIFMRGLSLGLDFSGGTLVEIQYEESVNLQEIRNVLSQNGYEDFQVVNFGSDTDVLIKIADVEGNSSIGDEVFDLVQSNYPETELKRIEFVGPQIGSELRDQGGFGMLVALGMILLYVAFRFQYKFAVGAVDALAHDVVIILGVFSIFSWEFDLTDLAALLAVIGYSLNDTIVVSDRIRENFRKKRRSEATQLIDRSLNQMLGRTLITSLTTLLVLFALLIFGGDAIQNFSLALIIGVLAGTYSSIYIVCNVLISMNIIADDLAVKKVESYDDGMP